MGGVCYINARKETVPSRLSVGLTKVVGLIGAVIIRLVVYVKSKNAKKFRKDVEYGSARWSA